MTSFFFLSHTHMHTLTPYVNAWPCLTLANNNCTHTILLCVIFFVVVVVVVVALLSWLITLHCLRFAKLKKRIKWKVPHNGQSEKSIIFLRDFWFNCIFWFLRVSISMALWSHREQASYSSHSCKFFFSLLSSSSFSSLFEFDSLVWWCSRQFCGHCIVCFLFSRFFALKNSVIENEMESE